MKERNNYNVLKVLLHEVVRSCRRQFKGRLGSKMPMFRTYENTAKRMPLLYKRRESALLYSR